MLAVYPKTVEGWRCPPISHGKRVIFHERAPTSAGGGGGEKFSEFRSNPSRNLSKVPKFAHSRPSSPGGAFLAMPFTTR